MKINEIGRSMVEMLGVLAIIGILSATGLYGYHKAMIKHKTNKTVNQMATIVNNIRSAFVNTTLQSVEHPYEALLGDKKLATQKLVEMNVFPDEMIVNANEPDIRNAYMGKVWVEAVDDGASFNVEFEDLPDDVAVALGTIDWGTSDASGLQEVLIAPAEEQQQQSGS